MGLRQPEWFTSFPVSLGKNIKQKLRGNGGCDNSYNSVGLFNNKSDFKDVM